MEPHLMSDDRTFNVTGMTCGHCSKAVTNEVLQVEGVRAVDVDLDSGVLTVRGDAEDDAIRKAVDEAGYAVA
jgi:copper chaperone CopZ